MASVANKGWLRRAAVPLRFIYHSTNKVLAKKLKFTIIGTGRCGTRFVANYVSAAGVPFSHERYSTGEGPKLRNGERMFRVIDNASALAVPFLPDPDVTTIHQLRDPIKVVLSFYHIGFFDPAYYYNHKRFVDIVKKYFSIGEDPLHSSMRWYLEWNRRSEKITTHRYHIENLADHTGDIANWLGLHRAIKNIPLAPNLNARNRVVPQAVANVKARLALYPEYSE